MALTTAGRNHLAETIIGNAVTAFNNANAQIGVGDGTTAFTAGQTDLVGTNKVRKAMDATYPTLTSGNVLTFRSTFGTADANFAWNEWGVFNAATAGTMLNRLVPATSLGTKPNTQTWQFTVTLTVNAP